MKFNRSDKTSGKANKILITTSHNKSYLMEHYLKMVFKKIVYIHKPWHLVSFFPTESLMKFLSEKTRNTDRLLMIDSSIFHFTLSKYILDIWLTLIKLRHLQPKCLTNNNEWKQNRRFFRQNKVLRNSAWGTTFVSQHLPINFKFLIYLFFLLLLFIWRIDTSKKKNESSNINPNVTYSEEVLFG